MRQVQGLKPQAMLPNLLISQALREVTQHKPGAVMHKLFQARIHAHEV